MALSSFGTLLKMAGTTIAGVRDISGPGLSLDTEDVTAHDSAGGWEVYVATILRSGEVTFDINFDPDDVTHSYTAGLLSKLVARALTAFTLTFTDPTPTVCTFSAFVTNFEPSAPVAGALSASVTLKISGAVTFA